MLIRHEMAWTESQFRRQSQEWTNRDASAEISIDTSFGITTIGHESYALRQAAIYGDFANRAANEFSRCWQKYLIQSQTDDENEDM